MNQTVRYLTHPQVLIEPNKPVPDWSLNYLGKARVAALAASDVLAGTRHVISSAEVKAVETATPLADALGCSLTILPRMHENDRSATGFLPPKEFEQVADQFFAHPGDSVRGWETAKTAQERIIAEVRECMRLFTSGDLLFVGHGGVGTLLFCALSDVPISRKHDQGAGGGGCYFTFTAPWGKPDTGWQPMENMIRR